MSGEEATGTSRRRDVLDLFGVPMPGPTDDPRQATQAVSLRLWSLSRVLLTPVMVIAGLSASALSPIFWLLLVLRAAWASSGTFAVTALRRWPVLTATFELAIAAALVLSSGGSGSPLRLVIPILPLVAGYLVGPAAITRIVRSCGLAYLLAALPDLLRGEDGAATRIALFALVLLFVTICAMTFALGRRILTRRAAAVDIARRRLLNAGLTAEDGERRRVSQDLHGEALQHLLSASQDLDEGDEEALRRARDGVSASVALLRDTVRDLHPAALRHVGLEAALSAALAHRVHDVLGVRVDAEVEGVREALLMSVVRELGDALAHAGAAEAVAARVSLEGGAVVVALSAGAVGSDVEELRRRTAGTAERVEADGGSLQCVAGQDGRAAITVRISRDPGGEAAAAGDADDVRRRSFLAFSALWLALVTFTLAMAGIDGRIDGPFLALLGLLAVFHGATLAVTVKRSGVPEAGLAGAGACIVALVAALDAQGGLATPSAALLVTLPFLLVLAFEPVDVERLCGVFAVAVTAAVLHDVLAGRTRAGGEATTLVAVCAWSIVSSVMLAAARQRMRLRLSGLERARRRILHESLAVADAERQRLSERLHDGALQELMTAGQDLEQAIDGDAESALFARVELTSAVAQLREIVADLHPPALEHGGLRPALAAVVDRARQRARFVATTELAPGVDGLRDEFLLALVRELVTNVRKHADADRLSVRLSRADDMLVLEVDDDGVGTTDERLVAAVADGHIGLAATRERVEADGGELLFDSAPGRGTRVVVRVPAEPLTAPTLPR